MKHYYLKIFLTAFIICCANAFSFGADDKQWIEISPEKEAFLTPGQNYYVKLDFGNFNLDREYTTNYVQYEKDADGVEKRTHFVYMYLSKGIVPGTTQTAPSLIINIKCVDCNKDKEWVSFLIDKNMCIKTFAVDKQNKTTKWNKCFGTAAAAPTAPKPSASSDKDAAQQQTAALADKSVVQIYTLEKEVDYIEPFKIKTGKSTTGTGFVYNFKGEEVIITNAHVANTFHSEIEVKKPSVNGAAPKMYKAIPAFIAPDIDLAMLRIEDKSFFDGLTALQIGKSPKSGETVMTAGFPGGSVKGSSVNLYKSFTTCNRLSFTKYIMDSANRSLLALQLTSSVMPGISGGPVFNMQGQVVGVSFQHNKEYQQQGYAIPAVYLERFIKDVSDGKYDGIANWHTIAASANPAYKAYMGLSADTSGMILFNVKNEFTLQTGLQNGDIVTKIADAQLLNNGNLLVAGDGEFPIAAHLAKFQKGELVEVEYYSAKTPGQVLKTKVPLTNNAYYFGSKKDENLPFFVNGGVIFLQAPAGDIVITKIYEGVSSVFLGNIVKKINGEEVKSIKDAARVFSKDSAFYIVEVEDTSRFAIQKAGLKELNEKVRIANNIPRNAFIAATLP